MKNLAHNQRLIALQDQLQGVVQSLADMQNETASDRERVHLKTVCGDAVKLRDRLERMQDL